MRTTTANITKTMIPQLYVKPNYIMNINKKSNVQATYQQLPNCNNKQSLHLPFERQVIIFTSRNYSRFLQSSQLSFVTFKPMHLTVAGYRQHLGYKKVVCTESMPCCYICIAIKNTIASKSNRDCSAKPQCLKVVNILFNKNLKACVAQFQ